MPKYSAIPDDGLGFAFLVSGTQFFLAFGRVDHSPFHLVKGIEQGEAGFTIDRSSKHAIR